MTAALDTRSSAASTGSRGDAPARETVRQQPTLELRDVVKDYDGTRAVDGVSLDVAPGEFLTLLGPSGCGKTTLMNMVAGFFAPTSGAIRIAGRDVTRMPPYRRNIGMVFQNYALFPHMTVGQNIAFGLEERRVPRGEIATRVAQALEMVRLAAFGDRRPNQLSGGQQQRVALARALVTEPQVLLLDEPLSALDKNLRTQMQIEIKQIQRRANVAAVFVTHDQNEALSLSDRIAVLNEGRIEQIGTPQEIYAAPRSNFVASFVGDANRIPATVVSSDARAMVIEIAEGRRLTAPGRPKGGFLPGSAVNLYVRAEEISLAEEADDRPNIIPATISAQSYQGSFTHLVAEVQGISPLMVAVPGDAAGARFTAGAAVRLRIDLSRASVLPGH